LDSISTLIGDACHGPRMISLTINSWLQPCWSHFLSHNPLPGPTPPL
jgi:hypothetical protein